MKWFKVIKNPLTNKVINVTVLGITVYREKIKKQLKGEKINLLKMTGQVKENVEVILKNIKFHEIFDKLNSKQYKKKIIKEKKVRDKLDKQKCYEVKCPSCGNTIAAGSLVDKDILYCPICTESFNLKDVINNIKVNPNAFQEEWEKFQKYEKNEKELKDKLFASHLYKMKLIEALSKIDASYYFKTLNIEFFKLTTDEIFSKIRTEDIEKVNKEMEKPYEYIENIEQETINNKANSEMMFANNFLTGKRLGINFVDELNNNDYNVQPMREEFIDENKYIKVPKEYRALFVRYKHENDLIPHTKLLKEFIMWDEYVKPHIGDIDINTLSYNKFKELINEYKEKALNEELKQDGSKEEKSRTNKTKSNKNKKKEHGNKNTNLNQD